MMRWMVLREHSAGPEVYPRPHRIVEAPSRKKAIEAGLRASEKLIGAFNLEKK